MNWIIRDSDKIEFHTHLKIILSPIIDDVKDLNWLISELEYHNTIPTKNLPVDYEHNYFILSPEQFKALVTADVQIIWGVILGIPNTHAIDVDQNNSPFVEFNDLIWKNGNIQHPEAIIEIICFDSGYTIVKFRDQGLSAKFKDYFDEAVELESYK
nr:hypothetical protein [Pedobacter sp. ASV19]